MNEPNAHHCRAGRGHTPGLAETSMARMRDANEHLVVASVRAQQLVEEAEETNRLKDEFLATVSHEFRTPLNAILGWARILETTDLPRGRSEHAIAAIGRSASALAHMVDDLLDTSRILEGSVRLAPQPVDLAAVTHAALDAVRPLATMRNVQLAWDAAPDCRLVGGDAHRLQQVFWNLLSNAVKFTPAGGRVHVCLEPSDGHMQVRVIDTGQGISHDFLPHVFERFRQADDATTGRHTGLGLGLGIVRQLVELHGGTVRADSPGAGQGATFTVRLPMAAAAVRGDRTGDLVEWRQGASPSPAPRIDRLDALRLLVVDGDAGGRMLTALILTEAGASVTAVASAREGLRMIDVERPHAMVSEIDLSDEDGYALIRQVRQQDAACGGCLPAVALTGYASAGDRARSLAAGFHAHVAKPAEPEVLTAAIAAVIRRVEHDACAFR